MKRSLSMLVYPALLLAWLIVAVILFIVVSQYDFVHIFIIPLELPKLNLFGHLTLGRYFLDLLQALFGAVIFSAACIAPGLILMGNRQKFQANYMAIGTTAFLIGELIFSAVFLTCIVLYRLTPAMVAIGLALGLLLGARSLIGFIRTHPPLHVPADFRRSDRLILVLTIAVVALAALYSSAVLGYDSVVDYFSQPKMLAVAQTAVTTLPNDPYLVSSFHTGILTTAMIQVFGDQAARMLSWINGLVILMLGLAIAEEVQLTARARLWFLALMVTSTAFVDLLGDGKSELLSTAPLLAGIYWMLRSLKKPDRSTFTLIGVMLGFAMITRPYNIFLAPLFVAVFYGIHAVIGMRRGDFDLRKFVLSALWMLPPLLVLGAFHLLQNWLWLGNPIEPLVAGTHMNATNWQWQFDPTLLNVYRLLYPLVATYANSPQSLGNVSAFVIGFLPFLLIKRVRTALQEQPGLLWLVLAGIVTLIPWLAITFTVVEIRYVLSLWALFFLAIAQMMDVAAERLRLPIRMILGPLVMLSLVYMGARTVLIALGSYSPVDSRGQAHCYYLDFCSFMDTLNRTAPPGERVFAVNAYRYYLRPDLFACASRAEEYGKLENLAKQDSPEFWAELYRGGFRYVTYETNYATYHVRFGTLPPTDGIPTWLRVTQLSSEPDGQERVYEIEAVQAPVRQQTYCQLDPDGIWRVRPGSPPGQE